jgi:hypothetical protein
MFSSVSTNHQTPSCRTLGRCTFSSKFISDEKKTKIGIYDSVLGSNCMSYFYDYFASFRRRGNVAVLLS